MERATGGFYSPGRVKVLLWRYDELVHLTRTVSEPEANSQRLPREQPEGGFESGAAIKADLDSAFRQLEPIIRRVVWDYYVAGYAATEIAHMIPGCNRWFVDRARHRGVRDMAVSLAWVPTPKPQTDENGQPIELSDDPGLSTEALHERMRMVVARAFSVCPTSGPPGYACPVIDCRSYFDRSDGHHVPQPLLDHHTAA